MRVEQAQIREEVLLVMRGQHGTRGRSIGDIGITRRRLHGRSRTGCGLTDFAFDTLAGKMTFPGCSWLLAFG